MEAQNLHVLRNASQGEAAARGVNVLAQKTKDCVQLLKTTWEVAACICIYNPALLWLDEGDRGLYLLLVPATKH